MSFQLSTLPSAVGSHSVLSCSSVTLSAKVFWGLATTVMPSCATASSINSTPFDSQFCCSSSLIGLEASAIWVSPLQNAWKPSPVPAPPTVICTSRFCWLNASAAAWVIGCTVLEPSTAIWPAAPPPFSAFVSSSFCPPPPPPQAARTKARARRNAPITILERTDLLKRSLLSISHWATLGPQRPGLSPGISIARLYAIGRGFWFHPCKRRFKCVLHVPEGGSRAGDREAWQAAQPFVLCSTARTTRAISYTGLSRRGRGCPLSGLWPLVRRYTSYSARKCTLGPMWRASSAM